MTILADLPAPNIIPPWEGDVVDLEPIHVESESSGTTEVRVSSLGRPPWSHLAYHQVAGTGERVPVVAGLYWDQGYGLGTYYSANGRSYLCNEAYARSMATKDGVELNHRYVGEHTGGVVCVNYQFDPAGRNRC